ncbi:DUF7847 domain-containing protein [Streptomyces sp. NBC_01217]|uniref:DUF7847 domain-containing protein n=1 Tax=Streptomyces sp. NBC_01217 TaxID=2903779 RepID=UPI002E0DB79D|nr:hypothetical protein OG507_09405 [Streptomyces sp. NBC_01217]
MAQDAGWGGGAYGGAPYGGAPGWGGGGWMPPPKPGVIPLVPLKLGDILGGAFSTLGRYWKQLFGIGAAVYGGALVVVGAAAVIAYSAVSDHLDRVISLSADEDPSSKDIVPILIALGSIWLVAVVAFMIGTAMMYATVPTVLQEAVLGRPTTFSAVWRRAWARVPAVIGTVFLTALIVMVPIVLAMVGFIALMIGATTLSDGAGAAVWTSLGLLGALATAPLATWLWVKFSLAPSSVVFEGQRPVAALRRSSQLVRGDWWRVFGISLLAFVIAATASYIIQIPFSFLGMFSGIIGGSTLDDDPNPAAVLLAMSGYLVTFALGQLIGQLVSATFPQLVTGLLYVDRRMRTENLGPALAEAAAVPVPPQYGP